MSNIEELTIRLETVRHFTEQLRAELKRPAPSDRLARRYTEQIRTQLAAIDFRLRPVSAP